MGAICTSSAYRFPHLLGKVDPSRWAGARLLLRFRQQEIAVTWEADATSLGIRIRLRLWFETIKDPHNGAAGLRACRDLFAAAISKLPLAVVFAGSRPLRETRRCGRSRKNRPGEMARNLLSSDFRRHKTAHNSDSNSGRHSAPAPTNCSRPFAAGPMQDVDPSPTVRTTTDSSAGSSSNCVLCSVRKDSAGAKCLSSPHIHCSGRRKRRLSAVILHAASKRLLLVLDVATA